MLAAIFVHLSKQEPDSPGRKVSCFVQDLVSVSHVCRSWRQVAITAPELWTEITMANPEVVKAFLGRSGAVPLKVNLPLCSGVEIDEALLEAVIPHTLRFRQLSVFDCGGSGFNGSGSVRFKEPAPLLERLVIRHGMGDRPALLFDNHTPRLRELVMFSHGFWLKNQLWSLTSLHVTLSHTRRRPADFHPFFDMLRRCPALEEMFVSWGGWYVQLESPKLPTIPLHHLRKLLLHSFCIGNIKSFLHTFDLKANGIAIHLSGVDSSPQGDGGLSDIQSIFPNDNSGRPSLVSSTKLELIFHKRPRTMIMHSVGPGFSTRVEIPLEFFFRDGSVNYTFRDVSRSVKELWVRGSSRVDAKLDGVEYLTALESLVIIGRGSATARALLQAFSPGPAGFLPCPLLSTIDFHGGSSEMRPFFDLLHARSTVGGWLERLRLPPGFTYLPVSVAPHVRDVGSLDIPSSALHMYAMELPEFCFAEGEHKWWIPWRSRLN